MVDDDPVLGVTSWTCGEVGEWLSGNGFADSVVKLFKGLTYTLFFSFIPFFFIVLIRFFHAGNLYLDSDIDGPRLLKLSDTTLLQMGVIVDNTRAMLGLCINRLRQGSSVNVDWSSQEQHMEALLNIPRRVHNPRLLSDGQQSKLNSH
ncbi:hypothetical protein BC829DRAFT_302499 [Chytridium lagenaria]|nr:hypothetical protein BC829DRAFT_302499 [Chytridium lagenaria]